MTAASDLSADTFATHLKCMEIWGGNQNVQQSFSLPGADVWLRSTAYQSARGGDIHYLSICGHGRILRLAIADVAGHGAKVADVARRFKKLMARHINKFDQTKLAKALNRELVHDNAGGRFVTALLASYDRVSGHLAVCNAGHPRPLIYRSTTNAWHTLEHPFQSGASTLQNVPLGVTGSTVYRQFAVRLNPGDHVVVYTDGYSDIRPRTSDVGKTRLLEALAGLHWTSPLELGQQLRRGLGMGDPAYQNIDDETLLIMAVNAGPVPPISLLQRAKVLAKMTGLMPVK